MLPRLWNATGISGTTDSPLQRVLIVGAGDTGQLLAWELRHNKSQPYRAVAFVDDDPGLRGKRVHGIPVLGGRHDIPAVIEKQRVQLVAIALPPSVAPGLQEVLALVEPYKIPVRIVPVLADVMEGRASRGEMREITMEDLLARETLGVDEAACRQVITGRVVLITGAAGSIGSELSRRIAALEPAALHLVDINETGLAELRNELRPKLANPETLRIWLCNIADRHDLEDVFGECRPQIVFHLAANKIVTLVEEHPHQAFETNVLGTLNVFEVAQEMLADQVILLSSHTAVNPVSVYGATKRIGELLAASMGGKTRFCAVRLTNVIDARGAVLGLFARQIQRGGPVSVTDPEVARYFLTTHEVAGLVIQAASLSRGGEVFVLDTGDEVLIGELAERLIRARGMEPGIDIEIIYTGLRPGEKLRENLIGEHERLEPTSHAKVQAARSSLSFSGAELRAGIRELEVDRRRRTGNLPARLHALARIDRAAAIEAEERAVEVPGEAAEAPSQIVEAPQEP
jgi:FlaA1/EpsC-like NDP-sugar epimerase